MHLIKHSKLTHAGRVTKNETYAVRSILQLNIVASCIPIVRRSRSEPAIDCIDGNGMIVVYYIIQG